MAPPLAPKRALPPEPPDVGNRVHKPTTAIGKASRTSSTKSRPSPYTVDSLRLGIARETVQSEAQGSTDPFVELDIDMTESLDYPFDDEISTEDSPQRTNTKPLQGDKAIQATEQSPAVTSEKYLSVASQQNAVTLMDGIKGLLDLTNDYLRMLEEKHLGVGADFLALLADGASRAMRGERIYVSTENKPQSQHQLPQDTWATKAKTDADGIKVFNIKRQNTKATPPKGQSKEDRRVMIRLAPDHEARKTGAFELRQKVQQLVSDKSLVSDVWSVPSGIAILAPAPAKAAAILQSKTAIEDRFGNATVERQERRTSFIIGPIPKKIQCLDGLRDPLDGHLSEKLASVRNDIPFRYMNWTRRSQNDKSTGYIRISVPESKSNKFPSRLRIFGDAVLVQRIRPREQPVVCTKCHGFHTARTCARNPKCKTCSSDIHDGPCNKPTRCLNCRGPHPSDDKSCPARPRRINGVFVRPTGAKLYQIRTAGGREFAKKNPQSTPDPSQLPPSSLGTESLVSSQ